MSTLNNIKNVLVPSIGKLPLAQDPGTFTSSGFSREFVPGRNAEDGGYTETHVNARLELNINLKPGLDVVALNAVANEDITITLNDGSVYMMMAASCENPVPIGNGTSTVVFNAATAERIN